MFALKGKKFRMLVAGVMLSLAMGALAGCGGEKKENAKKDKYNVGIVQIVEHAALDVASKGFVDGMAAKGFKEGQNVVYDRQNAQADQSNLHTIAQHFINKKVDLICAIATPAAQVVANVTQDIPIVATAVTDYEAAKLIKSNAKPGTNVTGTSDMNLVEAQLDLIVKLVPNVKTVGVIYNSSEINSQVQVNLLKGFAKARKLEIKEATVNNVNDIQQAARSLLGKVEAIYVPTDNVLASAMPALAMVTEEAKLPVVAGEGGMTLAGGVATLGLDYYKLGKQSGEMAADILSGKAKPQDMPIQTQNEFTIIINEENAKKIGLTIPKEILNQVAK
ncbi:MAG: ABC transporter substrate-binding protein [Phascolarctobacterium sp.]|nr:ABC transporter substrate-binding protein [Phascolarctobacterium sp.]